VSRPERVDLVPPVFIHLVLSAASLSVPSRACLPPASGFACRKNAAPAYRPRHARGGPQPHAVSQACAAFFVRLRRHAPNGRRLAGMLATERCPGARSRRVRPAGLPTPAQAAREPQVEIGRSEDSAARSAQCVRVAAKKLERFLPPGTCRDESAPTRCAGNRGATRRPISAAPRRRRRAGRSNALTRIQQAMAIGFRQTLGPSASPR